MPACTTLRPPHRLSSSDMPPPVPMRRQRSRGILDLLSIHALQPTEVLEVRPGETLMRLLPRTTPHEEWQCVVRPEGAATIGANRCADGSLCYFISVSQKLAQGTMTHIAFRRSSSRRCIDEEEALRTSASALKVSEPLRNARPPSPFLARKENCAHAGHSAGTIGIRASTPPAPSAPSAPSPSSTSSTLPPNIQLLPDATHTRPLPLGSPSVTRVLRLFVGGETEVDVDGHRDLLPNDALCPARGVVSQRRRPSPLSETKWPSNVSNML